MQKIWFNPEDPAGFGSVATTAKAAKTSKMEADKWLRQQMAYSLNKPVLKRFPMRRYLSKSVNWMWQMDLMEMIPYARINKGYRYILTCIDVFSRYARALPVKNKTAKDMSAAIQTMMKSVQPRYVQTDLGKEFYNSKVKAIFDKYGIKHYSVFSTYKACIVERFNRTLRGKITKYVTHIGKKVWYMVLPKLVKGYNNTPHRGVNGLRPVDVTNDMYSALQSDAKKNKKPKYKIGEYVRISKGSTTPFIKNFNNNWSDEVFQISGINTRQMPVMYEITDDDDQVIQGKFYEQELQVLPKKPDVYRIEKIIRFKGSGENKQFLVKWHGYKNPTWIPAKNINNNQ